MVEVVKQVEAGEEPVACGPVAEGEEEVEQGKVDKLIGKLQGTKFLKVAIKWVVPPSLSFIPFYRLFPSVSFILLSSPPSCSF